MRSVANSAVGAACGRSPDAGADDSDFLAFAAELAGGQDKQDTMRARLQYFMSRRRPAEEIAAAQLVAAIYGLATRMALRLADRSPPEDCCRWRAGGAQCRAQLLTWIRGESYSQQRRSNDAAGTTFGRDAQSATGYRPAQST